MNQYEDIIDLPHWEPRGRKRMSMQSRAAQFAPFAALTGYEDAVKETARLTDRRIEIYNELYNVVSDKNDLISDIPTLVIGWEYTKKLFKNNNHS